MRKSSMRLPRLSRVCVCECLLLLAFFLVSPAGALPSLLFAAEEASVVIKAPSYEEGGYCKFSVNTGLLSRSTTPSGIYTIVLKNGVFTSVEGHDIRTLNKAVPLIPSLTTDQQWFKFPLEIGKTWEYDDRNENAKIRKNVITVEKPEATANKAGILPSIKLVNNRRAIAGRGSSSVVYYYSEKIGCVTKATTIGGAAGDVNFELELIEFGKL